MGDQDLHKTLGDLIEIKSKYNNNSSRNLLWKKLMEAQAKMATKGGQKHHSNSSIMKIIRNPTRINTLKMIKRRRARRAGHEGSRRSTIIEKKVRTLKKLIPNGNSSDGLDGLFRDTAEYISNLQMRVSLMQAVINALSNSNCE